MNRWTMQHIVTVKIVETISLNIALQDQPEINYTDLQDSTGGISDTPSKFVVSNDTKIWERFNITTTCCLILVLLCQIYAKICMIFVKLVGFCKFAFFYNIFFSLILWTFRIQKQFYDFLTRARCLRVFFRQVVIFEAHGVPRKFCIL